MLYKKKLNISNNYIKGVNSKMKKLFLLIFVMFLVSTLSNAQSTYVGPETCLGCHNPTVGQQFNPPASDKTDWRETLHANGYSAVLTDANSMVTKKGIVNDYDQNGIDDFKDGLNFNNISSAFDKYKPNAPILAYSAANGYTITIGTQTHKVYLTYGGSGLWKQRYGVRINTTNEGESKDIYISPIQFNEKTHEYVLYHADAWYGASDAPKVFNTLAEASTNSRSLAKGCSGCHVTGLTLSQTADGEWVAKSGGVLNEALYTNNPSYLDLDQDGKTDQINIGCERCHGPGSGHIAGGFLGQPGNRGIIQPELLTPEQGNNLCGMCHSRGHSKPNGTFAFPYDDQNMKSWAPGDLVDTYYANAAGYWGDGKNSKSHHQQFYDFMTSSKPTFQFHQLTCFECHDPHGSTNEHMLVTEIEEELPDGSTIAIPTEPDNNTLCLACHSTHGDFANISKTMVANNSNADSLAAIAAVVSLHTHHPYDPEGTGASRCTKCHMPKIAKSAIEYDIHSHTFEVIPPQKTLDFNMPNSCAVSCHGKTSYPNLAIPITAADFTNWSGANQQNLASVLRSYYGPSGIWWKTNVTGIHYTDFKVPSNYELSQNYPNPFNPTTNINFSVPEAGNVKVVIYDAIGNQVEVLVDEYKAVGNYRVDWNAAKYASGVYFYRMQSSSFTKIKKMVLMK